MSYMVIALLGTASILYAFISVADISAWGNWLNSFFLAVFGIAVYYLAFTLLSLATSKRGAGKKPGKAKPASA